MPAPRTARHGVELGLAEHVCLALVAEGVDHGWAIGGLLAPDGEIGRIWSLSRPLTYRAIDQLSHKQMVTRTGTSPGRGRDRRTIAASARGRRVNERWLAQPVEHLRDVRTELLVKLALLRRAGRPLDTLLDAQSEAIAATVESLTRANDADPVTLWRRESARAVRRFLTAVRASTADTPGPTVPGGGVDLQLSARNQLHATVTAITFGDVLCSVSATLADGQTMTSTITREAVEQLDLAEGDEVVMVAKATETMIARLPPPAR